MIGLSICSKLTQKYALGYVFVASVIRGAVNVFALLLLFCVGLSSSMSGRPQVSRVIILQRCWLCQIVVSANASPEPSSF